MMSEYPIFDNADSRQIELADTAVQQSLAYDLRGKKQISFAGIKYLILNMSKEQPIHIDILEIKLERYVPDQQASWIWYATVKAKNGTTGLETIGASEQAFMLTNGKMDTFGRTKALSKAERNAYRKQIPEMEIQMMLNQTQHIQRLEPQQQQSSVRETQVPVSGVHQPTAEQLAYLKDLKYTGEIPTSRFETAKLIAELKNK